jgi:hypothetical protein
VAARVHRLIALVDHRKVEVGNDHSFARADWLAQQSSIACCDRGEATAGHRADAAAGAIDDLCLLLGIQPSRSTDAQTRAITLTPKYALLVGG